MRFANCYLRLFLVAFLVVGVIGNDDFENEESSVCDASNGKKSLSVPAPFDLFEDTSDLLKITTHIYGYACMKEIVQMCPANFTSPMQNPMEYVDSAQVASFAVNNKDTLIKFSTTEKSFRNPCEGTKEPVLNDIVGIMSGSCLYSLQRLWDDDLSSWREKNELSVAIDVVKPQSELIYGIAIDHKKKRVIVTFRGSMTVNDWVRNASANFKKVPNPHFSKKSNNKQPKSIYLHTGYHDYLKEEQWFAGVKGIKYDAIKEDLIEVFKTHKDYELFATGHSLGGALSTMFSFYIMSEDDSVNIPKAITLISFACPLMVGDSEWQKAYQYLEKDGIIRHLRVEVDGDAVPMTIRKPPWSFSNRLFTWTGINIKLYDDNKPPELKHSYGMDTKLATLKHQLPTITNGLKLHQLTHYFERLNQVEADLKGKQLTDLYQDREILGDFYTFE